MNKQLLMSLINCSDGESVNLSKFLSSHPDTPTLRSQLKCFLKLSTLLSFTQMTTLKKSQ